MFNNRCRPSDCFSRSSSRISCCSSCCCWGRWSSCSRCRCYSCCSCCRCCGCCSCCSRKSCKSSPRLLTKCKKIPMPSSCLSSSRSFFYSIVIYCLLRLRWWISDWPYIIWSSGTFWIFNYVSYIIDCRLVIKSTIVDSFWLYL